MTSEQQSLINDILDLLREIVEREPITVYNLEKILMEVEERLEQEVIDRERDKYLWR